MNEYLYELAQAQFARYAQIRANTAVNGDPIPPWDELEYDIKRAWALSLKPAFAAVMKQGRLLETVSKKVLLEELANRDGVEIEWIEGKMTLTVTN